MEKAKFWRDHLAGWKKSGLPQSEYCRRHRISASQLGYWKKKYQTENKIKQAENKTAQPKKSAHQAEKNSPLTFVPIQQDLQQRIEDENHFSGLTICLEKGVRIRLEKNFCGETLTKIITHFGGRK